MKMYHYQWRHHWHVGVRSCSHLCYQVSEWACHVRLEEGLARMKWGRKPSLRAIREKGEGRRRRTRQGRDEKQTCGCGACGVALSGARNDVMKFFQSRVQHHRPRVGFPPLSKQEMLFNFDIYCPSVEPFEPVRPHTLHALMDTCTHSLAHAHTTTLPTCSHPHTVYPCSHAHTTRQ